ncbi:hypothetical protein GCM10022378_09850 [Salinicoccus jeotgali]|uniref:Uncharacterized protein n=1 Tax=Salinicoccus jeotgali TaxID=381634 RepID=A0ABP7EN54_9STAP
MENVTIKFDELVPKAAELTVKETEEDFNQLVPSPPGIFNLRFLFISNSPINNHHCDQESCSYDNFFIHRALVPGDSLFTSPENQI